MNKGFTLVELIAVVTILGLLVIITTPAYDSISKNIKTRNYDSKKSTIKKQTLAYAERYLKDKIYTGVKNGSGNYETNYYCFTVEYLIQNGIISSDDEEDEYIENNETGEKYKEKHEYVKIYYDNVKMKLIAMVNGDDDYKDPDNDGNISNNACTYCDNIRGGCTT